MIEIERAANKLKINIHTSRPGIIIGRKGQEVDKLKQEIQKRTNREVFINIQEIQKPELDAQLVGESVAMQLEKRVAFRRAMRKAVESALRFGARGIKVRVSGRLNGAEIARSEWYLHGQLPLQTLRADIDYGFAEANTTYGQIGVKVWLYKGERLTPRTGREEEFGGSGGGRDHRDRDRDRGPRRPGGGGRSWRRSRTSNIMLMPKKVKYRKQQRGRMRGKAWRGSDVSFGDYGLKALEPCWLTDRQIEAARVAMTRFVKRGGKIWVRVFPDKPITKKPQETRMGKGKGAPEGWVVRDQAGPHPVRDGRRAGERSAPRDGAGGGQAADQDQVRDAVRRGEGVMKAAGVERHGRRRRCAPRRRSSTTSCSACGSRSRWGSSRPRARCATSAASGRASSRF